MFFESPGIIGNKSDFTLSVQTVKADVRQSSELHGDIYVIAYSATSGKTQ